MVYNFIYAAKLFCSMLAWSLRNGPYRAKSQPFWLPDTIKPKLDSDATAKSEYRMALLQTFLRGGFLAGCRGC